MATIKSLSVVSVPVSDQQRAKAFYADVLGFELMIENEFAPGQSWVQLRVPGGETSITLTTWLDDFPAGSLRGLILEVDDIAAVKADLVGKGVEFVREDMDTPWGKFAAFADPDGNRWDLHEPLAS